MILHHIVGSARAEKETDSVTNRIIKNLVTAMLASMLTLPSLAAWGIEISPNQGSGQPSRVLPLPAIPNLDSIRWMNWNDSAPTLRIDTLMSPNVTPGGVLQTPQDRPKASPTFS